MHTDAPVNTTRVSVKPQVHPQPLLAGWVRRPRRGTSTHEMHVCDCVGNSACQAAWVTWVAHNRACGARDCTCDMCRGACAGHTRALHRVCGPPLLHRATDATPVLEADVGGRGHATYQQRCTDPRHMRRRTSATLHLRCHSIPPSRDCNWSIPRTSTAPPHMLSRTSRWSWRCSSTPRCSSRRSTRHRCSGSH